MTSPLVKTKVKRKLVSVNLKVSTKKDMPIKIRDRIHMMRVWSRSRSEAMLSLRVACRKRSSLMIEMLNLCPNSNLNCISS